MKGENLNQPGQYILAGRPSGPSFN